MTVFSSFSFPDILSFLAYLVNGDYESMLQSEEDRESDRVCLVDNEPAILHTYVDKNTSLISEPHITTTGTDNPILGILEGQGIIPGSGSHVG